MKKTLSAVHYHPDMPVVLKIVRNFVSTYGIDADVADELMNETFVKVVRKLHSTKPDVLCEIKKFTGYYAMSVANRLKNYVSRELDYAPRPMSGIDMDRLPSTERPRPAVIISDPEVVEFIVSAMRKRVSRQKILADAFRRFGDDVFRAIVAAKLAKGIQRSARLNIEKGTNVKQNLTRAEFEYVCKLAGDRSKIDAFLTKNPDELSNGFGFIVRSWLTSGGVVVDDPTDCFGVGYTESSKDCAALCCVAADCQKAMSVIVSQLATEQKQVLLKPKKTAADKKAEKNPWNRFQGDLLPKDITVKARSRVGLKIGEKLFYRGKDERGWILLYWSPEQPPWMSEVKVIEKLKNATTFIVPDIQEFIKTHIPSKKHKG